MNYIDPRFESPQPGGITFVSSPHDRPSLRLPDPSGVTHVAQLMSEVTRLRAQLERAGQTADFLAASGDALRAENAELKAEINRYACEVESLEADGNRHFQKYLAEESRSVDLLNYLAAMMEAAEKAPPGVRDWLKAFGVYDGGSNPQAPASKPDKPSDPRSEALGRAMSAQRVPDGWAR